MTSPFAMKAQRTIKQKPIFQTFGLALAISALAGGCLAAPASEPANPNAEDNVRIVLKYFQGLSSNHVENRVLSGQFTDFGNGASPRLINRIYNQTTHWPAIIGVDYADFASGFLTYAEPNRVAKGYWEQGGLVTISAHLYNPANPRGGGLRDSNVDLASLLDPGTKTHARWMRELDLIAAGLQELKDADVVVLWRPFHEMNGGWFWWGGKDSATFIKLWRQMFDYFTKVKHLDNLLWVYAPNQGGEQRIIIPATVMLTWWDWTPTPTLWTRNTSRATRKSPRCPSRLDSPNTGRTARTTRRAITITASSSPGLKRISPRPASS